MECPCEVLGAFTYCTVHYLLNIVDPIHWIVYFLPSWWKFWKRKKRREWDWWKGCKKWLEDIYWAIRGKASGDFCLRIVSVSQSPGLERTNSFTCCPPVPLYCWHFHISDKNRARSPWAEMDGWRGAKGGEGKGVEGARERERERSGGWRRESGKKMQGTGDGRKWGRSGMRYC